MNRNFIPNFFNIFVKKQQTTERLHPKGGFLRNLHGMICKRRFFFKLLLPCFIASFSRGILSSFWNSFSKTPSSPSSLRSLRRKSWIEATFRSCFDPISKRFAQFDVYRVAIMTSTPAKLECFRHHPSCGAPNPDRLFQYSSKLLQTLTRT